MAQFSLLLSLFHFTLVLLFSTTVNSQPKGVGVDDGETEYDPYKDFVLVAGKLDRKCDPNFHKKYALPIYETNDAPSFKKAVHAWGDAVQSMKKQQQTCFGVYEDPADGAESFNFFTCNEKTKKCACHPAGPLQQTKKGGKCEIVESQLGSPCDFGKMTAFNDGPMIGLKQFYNKTANLKEMVFQKLKGPLNSIFFDHLLSILDFTSRPWGRRGVCHTVDKNLECLFNNKCGCLNVPPYFSYKTSGKKCVAQKDAICALTIAHYMDAKGQLHYVTVRTAECDKGLTCNEVTTAFEKYTIKTCGGTTWPESART